MECYFLFDSINLRKSKAVNSSIYQGLEDFGEGDLPKGIKFGFTLLCSWGNHQDPISTKTTLFKFFWFFSLYKMQLNRYINDWKEEMIIGNIKPDDF